MNMKTDFERRILALEARQLHNQVPDWQCRLEKYRRYSEGLQDLEPRTEEEEARLARYKLYFDGLEGVWLNEDESKHHKTT